MLPAASKNRNRTETLDSMEALLTKKLDELESEMFFLENPKEQDSHHPRPAALLSKLSFLKCLITAEIGGNSSAAGRLNRKDARISAMESVFSDDPKTATFRLRLLIVHKNLQELESMANEPLWHQSAAKIRSKIAFTKSLLANEDHSLSSRIAAVEEAFVHLSGNDGTLPSCSSTSCDAEEVGEEEAVALFLRKKIGEIEDASDGDDYDDAQRKIAVLRSLSAAGMKWKGGEKEEELDGFLKRFWGIGIESADRNAVVEDSAAPSSCSCTSSCFDGGEEKEKPGKEGDSSVFSVNETGELCSVETEEGVEGKSENADAEEGDGESADAEEGDGERGLGKLRAMGALMVGVFAVAAVGVAVGSFLCEKEMVHLVPT